ncbi:hypothetical protein D3C87_158740 [compost metagenome]
MYPIDWAETFIGICNTINAIGSLATVGAFLYLFKKDTDKQKQIDKLTSIAEELATMKSIDNERLNLSVRPDLKFKSMTNGTDGTLDIRIINSGDRAKFVKFDLVSDDLIWEIKPISYVLDKDSEKKIFIRSKGNKHINDCIYQININYFDKINNLYITELSGTGGKIRIIETYMHMPNTFNNA